MAPYYSMDVSQYILVFEDYDGLGRDDTASALGILRRGYRLIHTTQAEIGLRLHALNRGVAFSVSPLKGVISEL